MLQLCHAVTPALAGSADWWGGQEEEVSGGEELGRKAGGGGDDMGWGGKQQTNSFSFLVECDGCCEPLRVYRLAGRLLEIRGLVAHFYSQFLFFVLFAGFWICIAARKMAG